MSPKSTDPPTVSPVARNAQDRTYVAVIGDMVRSRRIAAAARRELQRQLEHELSQINRRGATAIAAKFLITVGDEFQGLLRDPTIVPTLLLRLEVALPNIEFRFGIGRDKIHTDLREYAIGMDGPAWHLARQAIEDAKRTNRLGGVFLGFGARDDLVLNGIARILHAMRTRLTPKQRKLLEALLENETQKDVALLTGVTKQAVSKQARAAGFEAYREGEATLRAVLSNATKLEPFP